MGSQVKALKTVAVEASMNKLNHPINNISLAIIDDLKEIHRAVREAGHILAYDTLYPLIDQTKYGVNGKTLLIDPDAASGILFSKKHGRPKTVEEGMTEMLSLTLDHDNKTLVQEIVSIKDRIGQNLFENKPVLSEQPSLDQRLANIEAAIEQIAADIYNQNSKVGAPLNKTLYNFNGNSTQTNTHTIMDLIRTLLDVHGGTYTPTHKHIEIETVMDAITSPKSIPHGVSKYVASDTMYDTYDQLYDFYKYKIDSTIDTILLAVMENTLSVTSFCSIYINGIEQPRRVSIAPRATGVYELTHLNIPLRYKDRVCLKIDTTGSNIGDMSLGSAGLIITRGTSQDTFR